MAKKFLTGLTLVNLDSDPLTGSEGELYFNTSASVAKIYKAGQWTELGAGSGGGVIISETAPLLPSAGDLWYQASSGSLSVFDGTYWVEINGAVSLTEEQVQDYASNLFIHSSHNNISAQYDDLNNKIILSTSASITNEQIQDAVYPLFAHPNNSNITISYDDDNNQIIFTALSDENIQDLAADLLNHLNHINMSASYNDSANQIILSAPYSFTAEEIQDLAADLLYHEGHTNIGVIYDDENNQIFLSASATVPTEDIQDAAANLFTHENHSNIVVIYDDENNQIILSGSASFTTEEIQDAIAPLFDHLNHVGMSASYDDGNNQIILSADPGSGITISNTAPLSPQEGDGWYNNDTGAFYLFDGTYWVEVNGIINGLTEDQVQDYVAPLFTHSNHTNVVATYDDLNNKIILNTSASITNIDSIVAPDYITFDTTPETSSAAVGTLSWDSGESGLNAQLNTNINVTLGQEVYTVAKNAEATTLTKGEVVMVNGASGQKPRIVRASNTSDATSARTFGIVAENIASGAEGIIITQGIVKNINTNGFNEGDILYLSSTPGQVTTVKPQAPNHYVFVGVVLKKSNTAGRIYVKPQNGYELDEIHNVRITSVQNDDILLYNSASSIWVNSPKQNIINTASAAAVTYLVDAAPSTLDTLNELAAALGDDPNFATTIVNALAEKLSAAAASVTYATKTEVNEIADITPLDNIKSQFDGKRTRFLPTYLGTQVNITNPYRLLLNINGIIQVVDYPELVWSSPLPRQGFWIDNDGYIVFSEAPPPGSTFDARLMAGSTTTTKTKLLYPFEPVDILLGE